ncbi:THO complex subunit 5 [Coemansia sp. IMI 209127]|nr:THO complex subunit 5 [Coemansia sp. IMI 209127]
MDMDAATEPKPQPVEEVSASINESAAQISSLCDKIESIASYVVDIKNEQQQQTDQGSALSDPEMQQRLLETVTSTFSRLRQLNRQLHEDKVALNAHVASLKRKTDDLGLELENKRREMAYIQRDIESTKGMETIYQTIDIIPEEEFLEGAPEEFKVDIDTHHKLMLSRLRYEIKQREALMESKATAKETRDILRKVKRQRIEKLEKTDSNLQGYINSITLLGTSFGVVNDEDKKESTEEMSSAATRDSDRPKEPKKFREPRDGSSSRIGTPRA